MSETVINIIIGVALVAALAFNGYIKFRRSRKEPLGRVASIIVDVNRNIKLVEDFGFHHQGDRMKTGAWAKNKNKVEFLGQEMLIKLSQVFEMLEDVNGRIDAAKKFKSDSYMAGIDVSRLKEPLARSKEQLVEWLQANMDNPQYQAKKRRLLGGIFK